MSKSKKHKTPNINPSVLARPRLDALFEQSAGAEPDLDALETGVRALMRELGEGPILDALVKRMEGANEIDRETLMLLVPRLSSPTVIDYLWQQVKRRGGFSLDAKMTMLVILKTMGEDVDLTDATLYIPARDVKATDLDTMEDMVRMGMRGLARGLRGVRDVAEAEAYMHRVQQMPADSVDGIGVLLDLIEKAEQDGTDLAADFLYAMAYTSPDAEVQQAAERALANLDKRGIKPITPAVLDLGKAKFYRAYMTDPQEPWQQSIVVGWERAPGVIQGLVFLRDFGAPWNGGLKDMFATEGMSAQDFDRQFKDESERQMQLRVYRTTLARAQATIAEAVKANRDNKIPLPKEYNEARHLVERWVLHPPAALVAADTTQDELGHLPLVVPHDKMPLFLREEDLKKPGVRQWLESQPKEVADDLRMIEAAELTPEQAQEVQDIVLRARYVLPVRALLERGETGDAEWDDYLAQGINESHIPDLIRMATDEELLFAPSASDIVWAPTHAWRALAQLRTGAAVEPLTRILHWIDDEDYDAIAEELPTVFGMIGAPALPILDAYLTNEQNPLWAKVAAAEGVQKVAEHFPETRADAVAILTRTLERFAENDPTLNAYVIFSLVKLLAVEAAPLMERAFAAEQVDESVMGDWEDVQIELGLEAEREKPKRGGWLDFLKRK